VTQPTPREGYVRPGPDGAIIGWLTCERCGAALLVPGSPDWDYSVLTWHDHFHHANLRGGDVTVTHE